MQLKPHTIVVLADRQSTGDAAVLCSLLCDQHTNRSISTVVRVATETPELFGESKGASSRLFVPSPWRCHEKQQQRDGWMTYLGTPDGVFPLAELERAILGIETHDDGGMADSLIICGDPSSKLMQQVALSIAAVMKHFLFASPDPFVITSTGSFRALDWQARQMSWQHSRSTRKVVFCAFASPLWFCRLVRKGVVLSVPRTNYQPHFLAQPSICKNRCSLVWRIILESTQQHSTRRLALENTKGPEQSELVPVASCGARMLYFQFQDASMILFPCLLASNLPSERRKFILSMVGELYLVYERLAKRFPDIRNILLEDTVLEDIVGSRLMVESTNNSTAEIIERISRGAAPIRCSWALALFIKRQADYEWRSATSVSPFREEESTSKDTTMLLGKKAVEGGLLMLLDIGQLLGMQIQQDLPTILMVVQRLQRIFGKAYLQVSYGGILWNDNQLIKVLCPRSLGLKSLNSLLLALATSPLETQNRHLIQLKAKM
jgi:hypothetical protein